MAKPLFRLRPSHLPWAILMTHGALWLGLPQQGLAAPPSVPNIASSASNINLMSEKGVYWYDRYRFDLAAQSFNRVLLMDPMNASALRWQGLIDLARGDVDASRIWLKKLQSIYGTNHTQAVELKQIIELNTLKRQQGPVHCIPPSTLLDTSVNRGAVQIQRRLHPQYAYSLTECTHSMTL